MMAEVQNPILTILPYPMALFVYPGYWYMHIYGHVEMYKEVTVCCWLIWTQGFQWLCPCVLTKIQMDKIARDVTLISSAETGQVKRLGSSAIQESPTEE